MTDVDTLGKFLAEATIAPNVSALRPDYRVLLLAVDGLAPGASDADTTALWGHEQLNHNDPDRQRLVQTVKPFLF